MFHCGLALWFQKYRARRERIRLHNAAPLQPPGCPSRASPTGHSETPLTWQLGHGALSSSEFSLQVGLQH